MSLLDSLLEMHAKLLAEQKALRIEWQRIEIAAANGERKSRPCVVVAQGHYLTQRTVAGRRGQYAVV